MGSRDGLFLSLVPYSMAIGPLGTLVTIEVASLKAGAVNLGYVMAAGSAAGVAAPVVWGVALDRYGSRVTLLLGLLGVTASIFALSSASLIPQVAAYYALASFFSSSVGITMGLIVKKLSPRGLVEAYSRYSMYMSLGYLLGDVAASAISGIMNTREILVAMGILSAASLLAFSRNAPSVRNGSVSRNYAWKPTYTMNGELMLVYAALVIFNISSGIFNTLYPYGLKMRGLSNAAVLSIITVGMGVQVLGYRIAPTLISRLGGSVRSAQRAMIVRGLSYGTIGVSTMTMDSPLVQLMAGFTFYPLAAGIAYAIISTTTSVVILNSLNENSEGSNWGLYNTIMGIAYTIGSMASGFMADSIGIGQSYIAAGAMLMGSAAMLNYTRGRVVKGVGALVPSSA